MTVDQSVKPGDRDAADPIHDLAPRIEDRLRALLPRALAGQDRLDEAMRGAVLAPGKRLRPLLTAAVVADLGGDVAAAIDAGCAVEIAHAASLILDDLPSMDNAALRRGAPTAHVAHGEDVAILAAIATLTGAYRILATNPALSAEIRVEAIDALTAAVGVEGLVAGQFDDLTGGSARRDDGRLRETNARKTGALFSAAAAIGAAIAGAKPLQRAALARFADAVGQAFQLLDDLMDVEGSVDDLGKDVGQDSGMTTMVTLLGPARVRHEIEAHRRAALAELDALVPARGRLHALAERIFDTGTAALAKPAGSDAASSGKPKGPSPRLS